MSSTTAKRCEATTKAGGRCANYAGSGSLFCFVHDPLKAQERKEARARGGRARHGRKLGHVHNGEPVHIACLADVSTVLESELNALLTLDVSVSRARAVGYLCGVLVDVCKDTELEQRIEALEGRE